MDEPTAALGPQETAQVGELIKQLKAEGIGIFLISHDLHDVFDLADRLCVMKNGKVVGTAARQRCRPRRGARHDHRRQVPERRNSGTGRAGELIQNSISIKKNPAGSLRRGFSFHSTNDHFTASVIAEVHAPSGALVMIFCAKSASAVR